MADKVILTCSECLSRNYVTTKNKKTNTQRLEVKKYCPKCGKHTLHKETKYTLFACALYLDLSCWSIHVELPTKTFIRSGKSSGALSS